MCKVLLISKYFMNVGLGQFVKSLSLDNNLLYSRNRVHLHVFECVYMCVRVHVRIYLYALCFLIFMLYVCLCMLLVRM